MADKDKPAAATAPTAAPDRKLAAKILRDVHGFGVFASEEKIGRYSDELVCQICKAAADNRSAEIPNLIAAGYTNKKASKNG